MLAVYNGVEDYVRDSEGRDDDMAEIFHSLNGFEDLEPGRCLYSFPHPAKNYFKGLLCVFIRSITSNGLMRLPVSYPICLDKQL